MNLYVSNLDFSVSNDDLQSLFQGFGEVSSANVIRDKFSQQSRGFGFVEIPDDGAAQTAIKELDGSEFKGRNIKVNVAKEREQRSPNFSRPRDDRKSRW